MMTISSIKAIGHMDGHHSLNWLHDMLICSFSDARWTGHLGGCLAIFHVYFGGCLAGHCVFASPEEILYILPKLATMSALCSWHVHCLGWVLWWSDRNRQGLLTKSVDNNNNNIISK